jgi:hypothetical protein
MGRGSRHAEITFCGPTESDERSERNGRSSEKKKREEKEKGTALPKTTYCKL